MPFARRTYKKKWTPPVYKKKYVRRARTYKKKFDARPKALTTVTVPYSVGNQGFPDRYRCTMKVSWTTSFQIAGASGVTAYWESLMMGNRITGASSTTGNGPSINTNRGSGYSSYAINQPSGVQFLLGNISQGTPTTYRGSTGPYGFYRVRSSSVRYYWIPDNGVANQGATTLVCFPINQSAQGATILMPLGQMLEQPYCKSVQLTNQLTTEVPYVANKMDTLTAFGQKNASLFEAGTYDCAYNTTPENLWLWYFGVVTSSADVSNFALAGTVRCEMLYDVEFFGKQGYPANIITG